MHIETERKSKTNTLESEIGIIEFQIRAHQIKVSDSLASKFYATEFTQNFSHSMESAFVFLRFDCIKWHSFFGFQINSSIGPN